MSTVAQYDQGSITAIQCQKGDLMKGDMIRSVE